MKNNRKSVSLLFMRELFPANFIQHRRNIILAIAFLSLSTSLFSQNLDLAHFEQAGPAIGAGGLSCKYKQVSGPHGFGGDFLMWGGRFFSGASGDPKLGASACTGVLNGNFQRIEMKMGGLTIENGFRPDPYFKWRVGFGAGSYNLTDSLNQRTITQGQFAYVEPMLVGVRPLWRSIMIEVGAGYTFVGATGGIKLEGPCLEVNLLFGRFPPPYQKPPPVFVPLPLIGGTPKDSY
ncbi:MAG: hypothetical protein HQM08_04695 [Candidatus Riflebacteria bacterium]|nr:hypothetical protein [Candidatus Riflebacteria bacterium]